METSISLYRHIPSFKAFNYNYCQHYEFNTITALCNSGPKFNFRPSTRISKITPINSFNVHPMESVYNNYKLPNTSHGNRIRVMRSGTGLNKSLPLRNHKRESIKKYFKENEKQYIQKEKNTVWKALIRCIGKKPVRKTNSQRSYKIPMSIKISLPIINGYNSNLVKRSIKHPLKAITQNLI